MLITGEVRKLEAVDIAYAGPAANEPGLGKAPASDKSEPEAHAEAEDEADEPEVEEERPTIRFSSNNPQAEFLYKKPGGYKPICVAPCKQVFDAGVYTIAVRLEKEVGPSATRP